MSRPLLSRLLGLVLALTAGFAAPASALAHGHAHRHEAAAHATAEQADGRHTGSGDAHDATGTATGSSNTPTVESPVSEADDHPHPSVDAALTTKVATSLIALVAAHLTLPLARVVAIAPPKPDRTPQLRAEAAHAPPPRLRAPPALLG